MDIGKLSPGERIIGGAGLVLFVDSFLPWFRFGRAHANRGGWHNPLSTLAILIALAPVAGITLSAAIHCAWCGVAQSPPGSIFPRRHWMSRDACRMRPA